MKMELDPPHSIEVITVSTTPTPGGSGSHVIPLQIELEKFPSQQEIDGNNIKMRRPVRPIDRQRMRPWLMELLDLGNVFGLRWTNRHQGIFQISWRHASRLGWNLETDGDVFERWARHTGIYKDGDPSEPKRWKANFRCALHSLNDVIELTNAIERRGRNACRTYRFLQSGDDQVIGRKRAKAKKAREAKLNAYENHVEQPNNVTQMILDAITLQEQEVVSEVVTDDTTVIVQQLEGDPGEDYGLHHDHDYMGGDKAEKTILVRNGIGSIVLQKEVLNSDDQDGPQNFYVSNLDQLASAAMSSAGLEIANVEEVVSSHTPVKKKRQPKPKKQITELEEAIRESDFSLKHLLTGGSLKEELEIPEPEIKKEKISSLHTGDQILGASSKIKQRKRPSSPGTSARIEGTKIIIRDTGSDKDPKIHGRKAKQAKKDDDEEEGEGTEPLMSSCLLLLEAATRLDKAAKKSDKDSPEDGDASLESEHLDESNEDMDQENVIVETSVDSEVPVIGLDLAQEVSIEDVKMEVADDESNPDGTIEGSLHLDSGDSQPQIKAVNNFLKNYSVSVSDGKIVVVRGSEAMGLFSGSSIQTGTQTTGLKVKGKRGRPPKNKHTVDENNDETALASKNLELIESQVDSNNEMMIKESGDDGVLSKALGNSMSQKTTHSFSVPNSDHSSSIVQKVISALANLTKTGGNKRVKVVRRLKQSSSGSTATLPSNISKVSRSSIAGGPRTIIVSRNPKAHLIERSEEHEASILPLETPQIKEEITENYSNEELDESNHVTANIIYDDNNTALIQLPNGQTIPLHSSVFQTESSDNSEIHDSSLVSEDNSTIHHTIVAEDDSSANVGDPAGNEEVGENKASSSTLSLLRSYLVDPNPESSSNSEIAQTETSDSSVVLENQGHEISDHNNDENEDGATSRVMRVETSDGRCMEILIRGDMELSPEDLQALASQLLTEQEPDSSQPVQEGVEEYDSEQQEHIVEEAVSEIKKSKFDSEKMMDPTAPLSLGEVPLFASSKGDSDSMSPNSDT